VTLKANAALDALDESVKTSWRIPISPTWDPSKPQGFRFHWKARISQRVEAQQPALGIGGGLPPKGRCASIPRHLHSPPFRLTVQLRVLPGVLLSLRAAPP